MKDINSLLELFVTDSDGGSDWSSTPFKIGDKVYATDRHVMLIIPSEFAPNIHDLEGYDKDNVLKVIPKSGQVLKTISAKDILIALKAVPTVKEDKECESCKGECQVEFRYTYKGRDYTSDDDCPVCDGNGSLDDANGKLIPDASKAITIGKSTFSPLIVKKIYQLCKYFDLSDLDLVSQESIESATLFSKNHIYILAMPVIERESVYEIK
ncbi:hypothetical protein SAMN05421821_105174 [Mucilaginibacter lappiensis]|uniref:Uncharacterized protein n=1 Tax=Mucilaginibacter lappiensis TaxID=354630 RepID=A0ABR6PNA0_9SPHI|nr:hypothetical protein [Mucilaginibacter lappiensis]MBB6109756.1 hypothetical protein [Mucilaginibacter lappiensis]SIR14470.1 hypothetical protein SAMN05421821_105174 [Mucilaginibacter lappiensis]